MYAIVEITGQQFKIEKNQKIFVHRISEKEGSKVTVENVLLIENKGKRVVFVERSVITDRRVFAELLRESGKISEMEWKLYDQWYEWLLNDYNVTPDIYVYLRASPDTSYKRMLERKRKEENGVPLDYIKSVSKKHDEWLLNEKKSQVVTLSVDNDFKKDEEFRENLLKIIDSIIEVPN